MSKNEKYVVIVGINFSSSDCGFAYSFMDENKIYFMDIFGINIYRQIPTEIILDDNNNVLKFGLKCKQYLKEHGVNYGHYFKEIKMHLNQKKTTIESSNSNKSLPLKLVIQKILEQLRWICLNQLEKSWENIQESNIKWFVTIPPIWGEFEKSIMVEACENAGIVNENAHKSFFVLEPEAALFFYMRYDNIGKNLKQKGEYYIVCYLGENSGYIVTHLFGSNMNLENLFPSYGENYGSNEIDKKIFENIIYKLFGYKDFSTILKKYRELDLEDKDEDTLYYDWCRLENDIKDFKDGINSEKIKEKCKYPINCVVFEEIFEEILDVQELVDKYNNTLLDILLKLEVKSKKKWIIYFPIKILDIFIGEQSKLISKTIKNMQKVAKDNIHIDINKVIFLDECSSNEVLMAKISSELNKNFEFFIKPSKSLLAIMEGGVLFGINSNIIETKKNDKIPKIYKFLSY